MRSVVSRTAACVMWLVGCSSSSGSATDAGGAPPGSDGGAESGVDGGGDATITPPPGPASITITSPADGASLTFNGEVTPAVAFTATGFTLRDPALCASAADCGDVWLNIDGADCNESIGAVYPRNSEGFTSPIAAPLSFCFRGSDGPHTVVASLHDRTGKAYQDSSGKPVVSATIHFTVVSVADDGGTE